MHGTGQRMEPLSSEHVSTDGTDHTTPGTEEREKVTIGKGLVVDRCPTGTWEPHKYSGQKLQANIFGNLFGSKPPVPEAMIVRLDRAQITNSS